MRRDILMAGCIMIASVITVLGIITAIEFHQLGNFFLLWATSIPLMMITVLFWSKIVKKNLTTLQSFLFVTLGSLAIISEVMYSTF